jgi:hypothetical protein
MGRRAAAAQLAAAGPAGLFKFSKQLSILCCAAFVRLAGQCCFPHTVLGRSRSDFAILSRCFGLVLSPSGALRLPLMLCSRCCISVLSNPAGSTAGCRHDLFRRRGPSTARACSALCMQAQLSIHLATDTGTPCIGESMNNRRALFGKPRLFELCVARL